MEEPHTEPALDDPMRKGMEGLIVAMKARKPAPLADDIGVDSTMLASASGEGDALARAPWDAAEPVQTRVLERGAVVGRYVVLQKLGAGGMGVVYAAYDPELDRKLALKLLLPGVGGKSGRTRLLREAQALAKLAHPNVVAVHDVGTIDAQVWLAMEFVQGRTLGAWLGSMRRWPEVVETLRRAGEGLAAAHAAGLLHRDFKPDNVMVGDDGRVRVMDFGLARVRPHAEPLGLDESQARPVLDTLAMQVTQAGTIVGTPSYMAPEQFDGVELTAAADQFAFCVTLWEALHGERPFGGHTWMELAANVLAGRLRMPPKGRAVPGWLRRACERGLSADPQQRWPSMSALLEALGRGRWRAGVRRGVAALGVVALAGAGVEGHRRYDLARRTAACEASGDEIESAWSPAREQALREGLLATGVSNAETTADKTMPWLETQATAWREARATGCLAADVRERWDDETLERSLWCLDERRTELESLVDELTRADPGVLQKAVMAAAGLSSMEPCLDERVLEGLALPAPEEREAIRTVRARVVQAGNLERAGRYAEGLELASDALEQAEGLAWGPLTAAALLRKGTLLERTGRWLEAEDALEDAYFEAVECAPEVAFRAATTLVLVVGSSLQRHDEGLRWGRHAEAARQDLSDAGLLLADLQTDLADVYLRTDDHARAEELIEQAHSAKERLLGSNHPYLATTLTRMARVALAVGDHARAKALLERALSQQELVFGPDHPDLAGVLVNLAYAHEDTGDYDGAKSLHERALAIKERVLDANDPSIARSLNGLALVLEVTGHYDRANMLLRRALVINERAFGPDDPSVALILNNLALVHRDTGNHEAAKAFLERALAIYERSFGPRHSKLAAPLDNLALAYQALGDYDQAQAALERALSIYEEVFGPDHPHVAGSLEALGDVDLDRGARDAAKAHLARALAIREHAQGPDHPRLATSLVGLAEVALAEGRPSEALTLAGRALALREKNDATSDALAEAWFTLARALWDAPIDAGRDRSRARTLAEQARAGYRDDGQGSAAELADVEAWLREHADRTP